MSAAVSWVWSYIPDFEWWETVAKLAPIFTALIALSAAIIALVAIWAQMHIARRRASIDFFLKTEMDRTMIDLYNKFKTQAPSITSIPHPFGRKDYEDVRAFLNICELIAVGVNKGAFSKSVSYAYWGDVIPESYRTAKQLITNIRNTPGEGSRHTYVDLEELAEKWSKKEARRRKSKGTRSQNLAGGNDDEVRCCDPAARADDARKGGRQGQRKLLPARMQGLPWYEVCDPCG
jgi:hypothetical protein